MMQALNMQEVNAVSGGIVPIIIGLVILNAAIWGAVAGKNLCQEGYACVK